MTKSELQQNIYEDVKLYAEHGPMPLKYLSAKYHRTAKPFGGIRAVVHGDERLVVRITKTGGLVVSIC